MARPYFAQGRYRLQHTRLTRRVQLEKYFNVVTPSPFLISISVSPMDGTFALQLK